MTALPQHQDVVHATIRTPAGSLEMHTDRDWSPADGERVVILPEPTYHKLQELLATLETLMLEVHKPRFPLLARLVGLLWFVVVMATARAGGRRR